MKAHIFAAVSFLGVAFLADPVPPAFAEPQRVQQNDMRFRGMDTNNDGRITRAEWRGNDRSFRNHDWNNDGVLSGDEVRVGAVRRRGPIQDDAGFYEWTRAGFRSLDVNRDNRIARNEWTHDVELFMRADRDRDNVLTLPEFLGYATTDLDPEDRFGDLDINNNGVVEQREWHGTLDAFRWLDRNNDGRLSRSETVENEDVPTGTSGRAVVSNEVVHVAAQTRWTDTGIAVRAGDTLEVEARGTVTLSDRSDIAEPAGARSGRVAPASPLPHLPAGGLIARIGNAEPFFIGDSATLERVAHTGRLYLSVNDDHLQDNTGQFRVTVSVKR